MKNVDHIESLNLRHLARMSNALEYYASEAINLSELIAELVFLKDSISTVTDDECIDLNNALMDLESIASAIIDGESVEGLKKLEEESIKICKSWIKKTEKRENFGSDL